MTGCSLAPYDISDSNATSAGSSGQVVPPATDGHSVTSSAPTGGGDETSTTGGSGSSGDGETPDLPGEPLPCDPWEQDCPEGQKCSLHSNSRLGNGTWCVPVVPDPVGTGEVCHALGEDYDGFDDCAKGAVCLTLCGDGTGRCVELCGGTLPSPTCPPGTECVAIEHFDPTPALCFTPCSVLAQDCPPSETCLPDFGGAPVFYCARDCSGDGGQAFDACSLYAECDPGLICTSGLAKECFEEPDCCTAFCDVSLVPDVCPGEGQECVPMFDASDPSVPPESLEVGFCMLPN